MNAHPTHDGACRDHLAAFVRRSGGDRRLRRYLMTQLDWNPSLDATRIKAGVRVGAATLDGFANTRADCLRAFWIARNMHGVRQVVVQLEVDTPRLSQRPSPHLCTDGRKSEQAACRYRNHRHNPWEQTSNG